MHILFTILLVIAAIIVLVLIRAASLNGDYFIEREIGIEQSREKVFDFVKQVKNQARYSKWVMQDPQSIREYRGTDGTVGFVMTWDSKDKQVGKGEQEIRAIKPGEAVEFEIRFERPITGTAFATMKTSSISETNTKLTWIFNGKRTYGMKIVHLLFNLKKVLGNDLENSLIKLKQVLESPQ